MSCQNDIDSENEDGRHQDFGHCLKDNIIFRFMNPVIVFLLFLIAFPVRTQQNQHGTGSNKQYVRFSQRVKCSVVKYHSRDNIYRAGLLHAFFNIALSHFIVNRVVSLTMKRQIRYRHQQHGYQENTEQYTEHFIKTIEYPDLQVILQVVHFLFQASAFFFTFRFFLRRFPERLLLLHFNISQIRVPGAVQPLPESKGECFLVFLIRNSFTHLLLLPSLLSLPSFLSLPSLLSLLPFPSLLPF